MHSTKKRKPVPGKTPFRRANADQPLPLLSETLILNASAAQSLASVRNSKNLASHYTNTSDLLCFFEQVTTVTLRDLPGCDLRTLSRCPHLEYLSLNDCHVTSTDGLEKCSKLRFVELKVSKPFIKTDICAFFCPQIACDFVIHFLSSF